MMRQGLLGGTFDPIHRGHLDVAEAARNALGLDRVVLVPCHIPPHRRPPAASAAHRFAMAALAVQPHPHLRVSDLEMEDASPSYTSTTLARLASRGVDLLIRVLDHGGGCVRGHRTWKDYPAILDRCHFVAVSRPGRAVATLPGILAGLAPRMLEAPCTIPPHPSVFLVEAPTAPVSSTEIRACVRSGRPIDDLVPAGVAAYIEKHGLYSAGSKDFA